MERQDRWDGNHQDVQVADEVSDGGSLQQVHGLATAFVVQLGIQKCLSWSRITENKVPGKARRIEQAGDDDAEPCKVSQPLQTAKDLQEEEEESEFDDENERRVDGFDDE